MKLEEESHKETVEKENFAETYLFIVTPENALFLWEKFLHLFENPEALKANSTIKQTVTAENVGHIADPNNYYLFLKALDDTIHEILTIGRQPPKENEENSKREAFPEALSTSKPKIFRHNRGKTDKETDPADIVPPERKSRRFVMPSEEEIILTESKQPLFQHGGSTPKLKTLKSNSLKLNRDRIVSGQSILSLFGKWLFEVAYLSGPSFIKVSGQGLSILAKIFAYGRGPFKEEHVRLFYHGLKSYFSRTEDRTEIHSLIRNCRKLFSNSNLAQNLSLQKLMLENIHKSCVKSKEEPNLETRRSYNKLIQGIICQQHNEINTHNLFYGDLFYYKDLKTLISDTFMREREMFKNFLKNTSQKKPPQKNDYTEHFSVISVATWNLLLINYLDAKTHDFLQTFVNGSELPSNLTHFILEVLLTTAELCLFKVSENPSFSDLIEDVSRSASAALNYLCCGVIEHKIKELADLAQKEGGGSRREIDELLATITTGLASIYTWILCSQKIVDKDIDQKKFLMKNPAKETQAIRLLLFASECATKLVSQTAKSMILNLCNSFGRTNLTKNWPFQGSVLLKDGSTKFGSKTNLDLHTICHLSFQDDTIITLYDFELSTLNEDLVFSIRNPCGKYFWYSEHYYKLQSNPELDDDDLISSESIFDEPAHDLPKRLSQQQPSSEYLNMGGLSIGNPSDFELEEVFNSQMDYEVQLKQLTPSESFQAKCIQDGASPTTAARYLKVKNFLLHMGLYDYSSMKAIRFIPHDDRANEFITRLDCMTERARIIVNMIYCDSPYTVNYGEGFKTDDKIYEMFLDSLGVYMDEKSLAQGTCDTLRAELTEYKELIYFSTPIYEILFCNILPLEHISIHTETRRVIPDIYVIWNARKYDKYDDKSPIIINDLDIIENKCAIVITPVGSSYFRVNSFENIVRERKMQIFPSYDGLEVSRELLPLILCQIITNTHRQIKIQPESKYYREIVFKNESTREKFIKECTANYEHKGKWETINEIFKLK